jgi:hypothetical protein
VVFMRADPIPGDLVTAGAMAERSVADADANRPDVTFDVLEAQARTAGVVLEALERLAGACLNRTRQLLEGGPKRR